MRISLISDVHSNLEALEAVWDEIKDTDAVLCMGDLVGYGASPNEVIEFVREQMKRKIFLCVHGNHDKAVAFDFDWRFNPFARKAVEWHRRVISEENMEFLRKFPVVETFMDDTGRTYLMVHGSPRAPVDEYVPPWLPDVEFKAILSYVEQDDLLLGHTHIPMLKKIEGRRIINPGSVGQPRDGDWRAGYAIIDTYTCKVEFHRVEYDVNRAAEKIRKAGLPRILADRLFEGF
ncbi:MAG: metallophosphoesterase family protein [Thermococci archaeon]|nr:metallophosphoesterase family protein [Thermococci archaeon]